MLSTQLFHYSHRVFPKGLKILFLVNLLRSIGLQFATFFQPLFLYQLGAKFQPFGVSSFQNGMILVGMYYLFERISVLFLTLPTSKFIVRFGVRNSMFVSQLMYLFVLGMYVIAQQHPFFFLVILLIEGVRIPLFWTSYYSLFSTNAVYKKMGESVGTIEFFTKLLQAAIPAIAGLVIVGVGFSYVFFIALFFQALAMLTLLFMHNNAQFDQPTLIELKKWLKEPQFRLFAVSMAGKYTADTMQALWPLFVLLLIGTADKVGYLYFVVFFISLLLTYFSGWFVDHSKSRKPFSISGSVIGAIWLGRAFVAGIWSIIAVDIFEKLAESIYSPFYDSIMMRRSKGSTTLSYFIYRELIISFAGVIFWGIFILFFVFSSSWRSFILLGFVAALMSMQLRDKSVVHASP